MVKPDLDDLPPQHDVRRVTQRRDVDERVGLVGDEVRRAALGQPIGSAEPGPRPPGRRAERVGGRHADAA